MRSFLEKSAEKNKKQNIFTVDIKLRHEKYDK